MDTPLAVPVDASVATDFAATFARIHDLMRSSEGLQPPEALDELLKLIYLFLHQERFQLPSVTRHAGETTAAHAERVQSSLLKSLRACTAASRPFPLDTRIHLRPATISAAVGLLSEHAFSSLALDLKSLALRVFLQSALRKGLGIYLTPDSVVRAVLDVLSPPPGSLVLDPACGSGSFLLHTLFLWRSKRHTTTDALWAYDHNDRVMRIAKVNLLPLMGDAFHAAAHDSLASFHCPTHSQWFRPAHFDYIFTNPPFGISLPADAIRSSELLAGTDERGQPLDKCGSEVLFLERCLDLLRPGGFLGIVVPNSVTSIARYQRARTVIDSKGQLLAVLTLPPETFASTGTQTTTSVLFFRRRTPRCIKHFPPGRVILAQSRDVGFDSTGRPTHTCDLPTLAQALHATLFLGAPATPPLRQLSLTPGEELATYASASNRSAPSNSTATHSTLGDFATLIRTGRTPARSAYSEDGCFILKVGNLTGCGIDWFARDRNFISPETVTRLTRKTDELVLRPSDILFTSSAHTAHYIAKKVDLVSEVPPWVPGPITFVGELMLVRVDLNRMDPLFLLAYLRSPKAQAALQSMVRGQTAHLHPDDAATLLVPHPASISKKKLAALREALLGESQANAKALQSHREANELCAEIFL